MRCPEVGDPGYGRSSTVPTIGSKAPRHVLGSPNRGWSRGTPGSWPRAGPGAPPGCSAFTGDPRWRTIAMLLPTGADVDVSLRRFADRSADQDQAAVGRSGAHEIDREAAERLAAYIGIGHRTRHVRAFAGRLEFDVSAVRAEASNGDRCRTWRRCGGRSANSAPTGEEVVADDCDDEHGRGRERELCVGVHEFEPPRRPPGTALSGRFHLVQHRPRDAGDVLVPVLVEPRPDGAGDVPVGGVEIGHCATSRVVGCASAFRAERSFPVA